MAANPHLPLALLLGAVAACSAAGCGSDADAQAPKDPAAGLSPIPVVHDDPGNPESVQVLPGLERELARRLPAAEYGCIVAPPDSSKDESAKLRVLVASPSAAEDASKISQALEATPYASVIVSPNQWRQHDRRAFVAALKREAASFSVNGRPARPFVAEESEIDRTSCPRVEIALLDKHPAYNRWARKARAMHPTRIVLTPPIRLGTHRPDSRSEALAPR